MEDFSNTLTATQLEAHVILSNLLSQLKDSESRYYERYGKWIERHPSLIELCFRCIRPSVWQVLEQRWNYDAFKKVGGDSYFEGRGIYFDAILGLDSLTRIYIGQSGNLRSRIAQHMNFRYRRDHPSLHYHAFQQSKWNSFGILCTLPPSNSSNQNLPGMDSPNLLLNVLEMWMCLVFRTLQEQTLKEWLPLEVHNRGEMGALNIALPLDAGEEEQEWVDISASKDPITKDYLASQRRRNGPLYEKNEPKEDDGSVKGVQQVKGEKDRPTDVLATIHITTPGALLMGAALLAGFMLAKGGPRLWMNRALR